MEPMSVTMKNTRQKVAGSPNSHMPTIAVPTAPMPVHTAYAVPMGKVCVAFTSSAMLAIRATRKPRYQP